jgi:hypothetical protein
MAPLRSRGSLARLVREAINLIGVVAALVGFKSQIGQRA